MSAPQPLADLTSILVAEHGPAGRRWVRSLTRLLTTVPLSGRTVLDVGGGAGVASHVAAALGATSVVCVDPYAAGSDSDQMGRVRDALSDSMAGQVRFEATSVQDYDPGVQFDVIMSINSINHLSEDSVRDLHRNPSSARDYLRIARKFGALSKPGSDLIIADCARANLFGLLGMRSPFAPTIEWDLHQGPSQWKRIFRAAGFVPVRTRWFAPERVDKRLKPVADTALGSFATNSYFGLFMRYDGADAP